MISKCLKKCVFKVHLWIKILIDVSQERRSRVILSPKNCDCLIINEEVLNLLPSDERIYYSTDRALTEDPTEAERYPLEFLHSLTPSGMPPHNLKLKVGAIIMLLRNISIQNGLCNIIIVPTLSLRI